MFYPFFVVLSDLVWSGVDEDMNGWADERMDGWNGFVKEYIAW
jgi:hypothetical protein